MFVIQPFSFSRVFQINGKEREFSEVQVIHDAKNSPLIYLVWEHEIKTFVFFHARLGIAAFLRLGNEVKNHKSICYFQVVVFHFLTNEACQHFIFSFISAYFVTSKKRLVSMKDGLVGEGGRLSKPSYISAYKKYVLHNVGSVGVRSLLSLFIKRA